MQGEYYANAFYTLMRLCLSFQTYKWNIWGFQISLLEVALFIMFADIIFTFIARVFGKMEVEG